MSVEPNMAYKAMKERAERAEEALARALMDEPDLSRVPTLERDLERATLAQAKMEQERDAARRARDFAEDRLREVLMGYVPPGDEREDVDALLELREDLEAVHAIFSRVMLERDRLSRLAPRTLQDGILTQGNACAFEVPGRPRTWKRTASGHGIRFNTPTYKAWKKEVGWLAVAAGVRMGKRVRIYVEVRLPDGRRGDVDNYAKGVLDALEKIAFENDRDVEELLVRRITHSPDPGLGVMIFYPQKGDNLEPHLGSAPQPEGETR